MSDEFAVTEEYQQKVLAFMLSNPEFCGIARTALTPEQFSNKALQWFFDRLAASERMLTPTLLQEELIKAARSKQIREEELHKYLSTYSVIKAAPLPVEQEYIREQLGIFIRVQNIKQALIETGQLTKEGRWEEILEMMTGAVNSGMELTDLGKDYFSRVEDRVQERNTRTKRRRLTTGIPELDDLTNGGIKNKQMGLIVGGTGRGKSVFLQWLARSAILTGKKVVYFTCELSEEDIEDRFDSMFAQVRPQMLMDYQQQVLTEVGKYRDTFGSSLFVKHYPADSATVGMLKAYVRQLSHVGIVPDLIIIDYLDLLAPHRHYNSSHEELDAITKAVVGFASELDTAVWTATQLNRSGLVADTPDEASMAGYVGKQYAADMVVWMAQTKEEREDEIMRLWLSKNRNGLTGRTIQLDTDYSYMTFYREQQMVDDGQDRGTEAANTEAGQTSGASTLGDSVRLLSNTDESESSGSASFPDGEDDMLVLSDSDDDSD